MNELEEIIVKKTSIVMYALYFCLVISILLVEFDLNSKLETTPDVIIVESVIKYLKITIFFVMSSIGVLSLISTFKDKW